jgi:hypothetical protein
MAKKELFAEVFACDKFRSYIDKVHTNREELKIKYK